MDKSYESSLAETNKRINVDTFKKMNSDESKLQFILRRMENDNPSLSRLKNAYKIGVNYHTQNSIYKHEGIEPLEKDEKEDKSVLAFAGANVFDSYQNKNKDD